MSVLFPQTDHMTGKEHIVRDDVRSCDGVISALAAQKWQTAGNSLIEKQREHVALVDFIGHLCILHGEEFQVAVNLKLYMQNRDRKPLRICDSLDQIRLFSLDGVGSLKVDVYVELFAPDFLKDACLQDIQKYRSQNNDNYDCHNAVPPFRDSIIPCG